MTGRVPHPCCVCFLHDRLFNDARSRWGDKENGVAGHGDTEGHQYTPKLLERLSGWAFVVCRSTGGKERMALLGSMMERWDGLVDAKR